MGFTSLSRESLLLHRWDPQGFPLQGLTNVCFVCVRGKPWLWRTRSREYQASSRLDLGGHRLSPPATYFTSGIPGASASRPLSSRSSHWLVSFGNTRLFPPPHAASPMHASPFRSAPPPQLLLPDGFSPLVDPCGRDGGGARARLLRGPPP